MQGLLSFGKSIREFKNTNKKPIFADAQIYPAFFDKHLVHPSRRIKALINDPNANIRAFYFQYLMLCYEIQNQNYEFYITKMQKFLLDPNFSFLFLEEDDEKVFNDQQFKRFLLQFMQILDSGEFETTQAALNAFPIADIVFVYFFRSLAIYAEITTNFDSYIDKTVLFGFLLENFNIDAQIFQDKCIKFIQAQVFVYQQSPAEIYLVYKDIQASLSQGNSHLQLSHGKKDVGQPLTNSKKENKQMERNQIPVIDQVEYHSDAAFSDGQNSGFKKNKIPPSMLTTFKPFEQQTSVLSREEEQLENQLISHEQAAPYENKLNKYENDDSFEYDRYKPKVDNSNIAESVRMNEANENQYGLMTDSKKSKSSSQQSIDMPNRRSKNQAHKNNEVGDFSHKNQNKSDYNEYSHHQFAFHKEKSNDERQTQPKSDRSYTHYTEQVVLIAAQRDSKTISIRRQQSHQISYTDGLANRQKASISTPISKQQSEHVAEFANRNHSSITNSKPINHPIQVKKEEKIPYYPVNQASQGKSYSNSQPTNSISNKYQSYDQNNYNRQKDSQKKIQNQSNANMHTPINKVSSYVSRQSHFVNNVPSTQNTENTSFHTVGHFSTQSKPHNLENVASFNQQPNAYSNSNSKSNGNSKFNTQTYVNSEYIISENQILTSSKNHNSSNHRQFRQQSKSIKQTLRNVVVTKLSVSKEFTDSITLMKMGEPYMSNIKKMKARSRQYRKSIINFLETY